MPASIDNYHIEMRPYRIIGWTWCTFCLFGMGAALVSQLYWSAMGCAVSSLFGVYMALGAGNFDLDSNGLTHRSSFGTWHIRWEEITSVEIGEVEGTLVLHGGNKRFILSSPGGWDAGKEEAFAFVIKQLEARDIPPKPSRTAAYKIMKNTRVR